jgi:hypothetical protein
MSISLEDFVVLSEALKIVQAGKNVTYPSRSAAEHVRDVMRRMILLVEKLDQKAEHKEIE